MIEDSVNDCPGRNRPHYSDILTRNYIIRDEHGRIRNSVQRACQVCGWCESRSIDPNHSGPATRATETIVTKATAYGVHPVRVYR